MPRGKPFSGKKKKEQLKEKREKKHAQLHRVELNSDENGEEDSAKIVPKPAAVEETNQMSFFQARPAAGRGQLGRYALIFRPETKEQIEKLKEDARKTIIPVQEEYLECKIEDFYTPDLDFPTRPPWNYNLSVEELENNEKKYFMEYLRRIDAKFEQSELSYFELNLETWRQFWRVLEMSDILLCVVDIRYPPLLFPPKLYDYACKELGKNIIVVFNKIDLAPAPLVLAWKDYFKEKYPELDILCFTSYPSYNLHGNENEKSMKGRRRKGKLRMAAEGALEIYKVCERIVGDKVDLSQWKNKILEEMQADEKHDEDSPEVEIEAVDTSKPDTSYFEFQKFHGGILTIGCLGQPNVGKSSLINALMGKKVVSVSKTPGHTKHFQTIFLTKTVRLCDCPGLIFPSQVPKSLQVLCGSYPIAQLREPYSTIKYLAERLDLPKILRITHPEGEGEEWCAFDICDGWARKRGFYTAKASRPDSYRAANHILRLALDGRICLCLRPPNYLRDKAKWEKDPRIAEIEYIQAKTKAPERQEEFIELSSDEEDFDEKYDIKTKSDEDNAKKGQEKKKKADESDNTDSDSGSSVYEEEEPEIKVVTKKTAKKAGNAKLNIRNKFALLDDSDD